MEKIYVGPTGSGKTTLLKNKFIEIAEREKQTQICLVFVKNATSVTEWRASLDLKYQGPIKVYTYFGFIQKEITKYWGLIEAKLKQVERSIEPTFMNVETSHYLMSQLVDEARSREGAFAAINATSEQIAVQLIDNLNHAAMNRLSFSQVQTRLTKWANSDQEKITSYKQALMVMDKFRNECLESGCLDYSLITELYNQYLLSDTEYLQQLLAMYQYLIVDNLEKSIPAAQDLFLKIIQNAQESYLSFNPEGGFTSFFGGNPKLAQETFFPICEIISLDDSFTSSKQARELANSLTGKVLEGKVLQENDFIKKEIQTDLRGDMLLQVGAEITHLLEQGVMPGEIAIIAPLIDKVMDFTLEQYFTNQGYQLAHLNRNKRLVDEPFATVLITLAILVNPDWQLELNFSALVQTFSLILKLDPIRSAILAEEIFKNKLQLPELEELQLRPRLGFDNSDKYDLLREWIKEKQAEKLEMEHFFQIVFGELLAPLNPTEKDILACRQIINSIARFKKVMKRYSYLKGETMGEKFIDMVLKGTLAADILFRPPSNEKQIILATPYTFLFSPYIKQVSYLFWLDVASERWLQSSTKELSNPYILSKEWQEADEWSDEVDQSIRKEQLINYIQSLLSKCTIGLYLANSYLDSRGWEQEGQLFEWLQSDSYIEQESSTGVKQND